MAKLEFGVAVRDITPSHPVWAHGYAILQAAFENLYH